jgi:hypothetical protein
MCYTTIYIVKTPCSLELGEVANSNKTGEVERMCVACTQVGSEAMTVFCCVIC